MSQDMLKLILEPILPYRSLTSEIVARATPQEAEAIVIGLIAERASVKDGGKILSFPDFNENPDLDVNRLLARILVSQIDPKVTVCLQPQQIAILSIENSAAYLAVQVAEEMKESLGLSRKPRIIRIRKSQSGTLPSPAMGQYIAQSEVYPITSDGVPKFLIASMSNPNDLKSVHVVMAIDDFRATGSTLTGGVEIGTSLLSQTGADMSNVIVIPMAGLGKPEQEKATRYQTCGARVSDLITAIDVRFWADQIRGYAMIQANGFQPYRMHNATIEDFTSSHDSHR